jgi:hypothetical protein
MIFDNSDNRPILIGEKLNDKEIIYSKKIFEDVMSSKIKEPKQRYVSQTLYDAVVKAFDNEMEKRRKLGLPIIISRNGKIININPQAKWKKNDGKENLQH